MKLQLQGFVVSLGVWTVLLASPVRFTLEIWLSAWIPLPSLMENKVCQFSICLPQWFRKKTVLFCCSNWELLIHLTSGIMFTTIHYTNPSQWCCGCDRSWHGECGLSTSITDPNTCKCAWGNTVLSTKLSHFSLRFWNWGLHSKESSVILLVLKLFKNNACLEVLCILLTFWLSCRKAYYSKQTQSLTIVQHSGDLILVQSSWVIKYRVDLQFSGLSQGRVAAISSLLFESFNFTLQLCLRMIGIKCEIKY